MSSRGLAGAQAQLQADVQPHERGVKALPEMADVGFGNRRHRFRVLQREVDGFRLVLREPSVDPAHGDSLEPA